MDANHPDIHKNYEKTCDEKISNHVVLNLNWDKFAVICFKNFELLVVADFGSLLETCAKGNGDVFTVQVTHVSLVVDRDAWMMGDSHQVLPFLVLVQNGIVEMELRSLNAFFNTISSFFPSKLC